MPTATYTGPEGFSIAGVSSLVPGERYDVSLDLAAHKYFGGKPEGEPTALPESHAELDKIAEAQASLRQGRDRRRQAGAHGGAPSRTKERCA